jgi:hypothetical protein
MKWLVLLLIAGAGTFFGYPLANEDAGGECDALERVAVRVSTSSGGRNLQPQEQVLGQFLQGFSKGQFASIAVRNKYPNIPASAACAMLYWRAILDPEGFRADAAKLRS